MRRYDPLSRARARRAPWWLFVYLAVGVPVFVGLFQLIRAAADRLDTAGTGESDYTGNLGAPVTVPISLLLIAAAVVLYTAQPRVRRDRLGWPGWHFARRQAMWAGGRYRAFPLRTPHALHTTDMAWGPRGGRMAYAYTAWPGERYRYSIEAVELDAATPAVAFTHEGLADAVAALVGGQDYQTESIDFNRRWRVQTTVERFAAAFLNPVTMARLLEPDLLGFNFVIDAGTIYCWTPGLVDLDGIGPRLDALARLAELIPPHALQQYGAPRPAAWGPARA